MRPDRSPFPRLVASLLALVLALGAILLAITFIINVVMLRLQGKTMDE